MALDSFITISRCRIILTMEKSGAALLSVRAEPKGHIQFGIIIKIIAPNAI